VAKIGLAFLLLAAASAPAAAGCPALHQPRDVATVIGVENAWVHALETKDAAALSCILAPGFADATWDGNVWSREQVLAALPQRKPHAIRLSNVKVRVDGDTAMIRGVNTLMAPDGKAIAAVDFTDMFKYRGGRWRAVTAQEVLRRH
jgi:ketosteroid isomerase-like protein